MTKSEKELTREERRVIEECSTEPKFSSDLLNLDKKGTFKCKKCDQRLFDSEQKFNSGTGWPSFYDVANSEAISTRKDRSEEVERIEVICSNCEAHLGHLFDDGPQDKTGKRYCINGISLEFEEDD